MPVFSATLATFIHFKTKQINLFKSNFSLFKRSTPSMQSLFDTICIIQMISSTWQMKVAVNLQSNWQVKRSVFSIFFAKLNMLYFSTNTKFLKHFHFETWHLLFPHSVVVEVMSQPKIMNFILNFTNWEAIYFEAMPEKLMMYNVWLVFFRC